MTSNNNNKVSSIHQHSDDASVLLVKVNITLVINSSGLTGSGLSSSLEHDVKSAKQKSALIKNLVVFIIYK